MSKLSILVKNIKKRLFGSDKQQTTSKPGPSPREDKAPDPKKADIRQAAPAERSPYLIQIGFDFGTSYCKCICRDIMIDKAWVHLPPTAQDQEFPFLLPSTLVLKDGIISHESNCRIHYPENGLYHLKHALVKTALQEWNDPALTPYCTNGKSSDPAELSALVESCAVYFLAGALGTVREDVRRRLPNFGKLPNDYMAINMAVPVAEAERPTVNELYHKVLCEAWNLADQLAGHPPLPLAELESLRRNARSCMSDISNEACFIYPEVSANVQGFVRSRVSSPGIYLFSDTGAGTVDQSTFIFIRRNEDQSEHLTYLHGGVFPLGSSHIEQKAASMSGSSDWASLERWRVKKESGDNDRELRQARDYLAVDLQTGTRSTIAFTKRQLFDREQLNEIKVIFGGGGHCDHPYKSGVMEPFQGDLFRNPITPGIIGLPIPRDLDLSGPERLWMKRLSVAYGLSFEKGELAGFTYPRDVVAPEPDQIWPRRRIIPDAPTQDQC